MKHQDNTLDLIFSIVDDFCKKHLKKKKRRKIGSPVKYYDNQILKMIAVKYLLGINSDRSLVRILSGGIGKRIFSSVPDHSRFNRRSKELFPVLVKFQKFLSSKLHSHLKVIRLIDSTPIPVVSYLRSSRSTSFPEASYGYCAAKDEKYYGFKLHMLITTNGVPTNFDLTPANIHDLSVTEELTEPYQELIIVGDKGYLSKTQQQELQYKNKILITSYRKNQKQKNNWFEKKLLKSRRKIETVFSQLKEHMNLENTKAKSLLGLASRIMGIIFSFTLGIFVNKLLGRKLLNIKSLLV